MIKWLLPLASCVILATTFTVYSQELAVDESKPDTVDVETGDELEDVISQEVSEEPPAETDESLWEKTSANVSLENLSVYLAEFPDGKYANEAKVKFEALEEKARARAKEDKALDAYRKRRIAGGLVLELDSRLTNVQPYVRSMLNSCGYTLVEAHRFAKRVYPTLVFNGKIYNNKSDGEHVVTLALSLELKTKTREIKAREKMRSYRTSEIDTHQALIAAFEDVGAQMKSGGFCAT